MVLQRVCRVVRRADHAHAHLLQQLARTEVVRGKQRRTAFVDLPRVARPQHLANVEVPQQLEVRPVEERVADGGRDRRCPRLELLDVGGVPCHESLGDAAGPHGAPLVVVSREPCLRQRTETPVLGDVGHREVAVVVEDGQGLGVPVVQPLRPARLQEELRVDEAASHSASPGEGTTSILPRRARYATCAPCRFLSIRKHGDRKNRLDRDRGHGQVNVRPPAQGRAPGARVHPHPGEGSRAAGRGGCLVREPEQVAVQSDVVFSMVGFPADVEEVILGGEGVLAGAEAGSVVCDMTTSEPSLAVRIHAEAAAKAPWPRSTRPSRAATWARARRSSPSWSAATGRPSTGCRRSSRRWARPSRSWAARAAASTPRW